MSLGLFVWFVFVGVGVDNCAFCCCIGLWDGDCC